MLDSNVLRFAREIKSAISKKPCNLVILHGAGGFGYPLLEEYDLYKKILTQRQRVGVAKLIASVSELNSMVAEIFINGAGVKVFPLSISASTVGFNGKVKKTCNELIETALKSDYVPLLHGSLIPDEISGYSILTGDEIIDHLSLIFGNIVTKIVVVTDVDGLHTADPKKNKNAKLIENLDMSKFQETFKLPFTEKIIKKSSTLLRVANEIGIPSVIINGQVKGLLEDVLVDREVNGTHIYPN